jgi:hypothetical protein
MPIAPNPNNFPRQQQPTTGQLPGGQQIQTTTPQQSGNWWSRMSPEMQATLVQGGFGLGGGVLAGMGQERMNSENNAASAEQQALNRAMQLYLAQMNNQQRQAEVGLQTAQAAPSRQDWRQRQALVSAIMPQLRNAQVTPPGDLGRFTPQVSGGLRLPEGGFDAQTLAFFSPEARVAAEADLDRAGQMASGGQMPTPNYAGGGYGQAGTAPAQQVTDYAAKVRQQAQQMGLNQAMQRATQTRTEQARSQPQQQQNQGPSTGQRLGNAALQFGMSYLMNRYGGGQPQGQQGGGTNWVGPAMAALGGYFGR